MKVGIIGAMDSEVALLHAEMEKAGAVNVTFAAGREFHEGTLRGVPVVVVKCGVGMVNAASCTQALIDVFGVTEVVNTGVAGSLDASIEIGDLVVATDAVNHVMDVANLGYALGQTPDFDRVSFPASQRLRTLALAAAAELDVPAHEGRVASGDRFVREAADKERIVGTFEARCCEMEGAAIAQVCYLADVPYLILRAISDKADGSSSVDYPTFEAKAADTCAALTLRLLEQLAA